MVFSGSQLLLVEKGAGKFSTVLRYGSGEEDRLPVTTPAKDLIAATEIDYRKAELVEETVWQRMVSNNLGFDAETHYPETMLELDLGAEVPQWELRTADELRREDQQRHQNLREKYGKR